MIAGRLLACHETGLAADFVCSQSGLSGFTSRNAGDIWCKIPKCRCSQCILRHRSPILLLIDCRGPMSPLIHHISSDETLPKSADVVVIGGGIVGVPPTQLPAT